MQLTNNQILGRLKKRLKEPLPGSKAHAIMCPRGRNLDADIKIEPRQSAVLIILYIENKTLKIILIKRSEYEGFHSGQIAFPGGKKELTDASLKETAIREAFEEIGIHKGNLEILGQLTKLYIPISNMEVHPFVGFYKSKPLFVRQKKEVARVLSPNFSDFLNDESVKMSVFSGRNYRVEAPYYIFNELKIWGATAMILSELILIYKEIIY